jgi:serine/threonine protein kinase
MTPERWRQVEAIVHAALARRESERMAFLADACAGDEALRLEVESLLTQQASADRFLKDQAIVAAAQMLSESETSVLTGRRLGAYEVQARLGAGGMGEVYRARDTQLGRDVAIKILPSLFTRDTDRLARFEREARVLAALNHPHIGAIYGLEDVDGVRALVLELVEGETLADRIARVRMPLLETLSIAQQIADALEAAHEKGIIHRDLKPANIKVRPDGTVKVLDFGLAKALEPIDPTASPTMTSPVMTGAGVVLGTAAYMSPEQARGLPVDKRTDIWAFGNVLYEMLTGRQAFAGDTVTEVLARVMEREPDWTRLPKNTPGEIQHLLRRSLQKDRNRRLQTITDARIEIEESSAKLRRTEEKDASTAPRSRERLAWKLGAAVFFVAVVALAIPSIIRLRETPPADAPEMRVDLIMPANTAPTSFAISPDGRRLVFVASSDGPPRLWLRPLDGVTAQPLPGTEGAVLPFWSPDSRSVGFISGETLKRVDIDRGVPQTLALADFFGGTWSSDGTILFSRGRSLFRIAASGGDPVAVTKPALPPGLHSHPEFLPGGRQFLFYVAGSGQSGETAGIYLGSLDTPEVKRITAADSAGLFLPPSWLLYLRQGTLEARRFDPSRGELTGDPVTVADPVWLDAVRPKGAFSVSMAGLVAYRSAGGSIRRQLTWFDRSGNVLGTLGAPDENNLFDPSLSPDGRRVAAERTIQGNTDLWIIDAERMTRFTFDAGYDGSPMWSSDGSRIAFQSNKRGTLGLYQKPSNGAGTEELIFEVPESTTLSDWSRDGRFVIGLTNLDLWVWPLAGDRKPWPFLNTKFDERGPHFSPDGRWVAYHSNESGRYEVYVRPFLEPGGLWQISTAGGSTARWRHDGRELYYVTLDGKLMAVPITTQGATLESGTPTELFQIPGPSRAGLNRGQVTVAADGRFLANVPTGDGTNVPITLLLNWKPPAN